MGTEAVNLDEIQRRKLQEYIFDLEDMLEKAEDLAVEHEKIKQARSLLNAILDATSHGICLIRDQKLVWANRGISDIVGWSMEELQGRHVRKLFPDDAAYRHVAGLIEGSSDVVRFESELKGKRSQRIPCMVTFRQLDARDANQGYLFSFTDVTERKRHEERLRRAYDELEARVEERTRELNRINDRLNEELLERKRAEEALQESEEKYRTLLQSTPEPVAVYDMKGRVLYFNPAFTEVFGWSLKERLGEKMDLFVPDEAWPETQRMIQAAKQGRRFAGIETRRRTKDGRKLDVSISGTTFHDREGRLAGSIVTLRDITRQKRIEAQLQEARKLKSIGTLAGGIAHDFNNLLMGFQGNISLMLLESRPGTELNDRLKSLEKYIQRGAHLTRRLLDFARGGKYEVRATHINQLLRNTTEMFARTKKEISVLFQFGDNLPLVEVDQGQMEQVFLNLFINAWQAMPNGGTISIQTEQVQLDAPYVQHLNIAPGSYIRISVTDSGVGIEKEIQNKIFDPFFTTKEVGIGTGLGLASVYGIVTNHGGVIQVESEKGKGATFTIHLPVSRKAVEGEKTEKAAVEILGGNETVMLVDDEEMIIEVGREILQRLGYRVLTARSGEEALQLYRSQSDGIDMIILDLVMPVLGGRETFYQIRDIDPDARVLLSSGYSVEGEAADLLKDGCMGFIQKPFNLMQISQKLREVLDK